MANTKLFNVIQLLFNMSYINKFFALAIIISMALVTLIMLIPPMSAQAEMPVPSLPTCDVTLQGPWPKYVPPVYEVNPSTGKTILIKDGYTVYEKSLWVRMAPMQIFMPYTNSEGQMVNLFFNLRWKDHQDTVWQSLDQVWSKESLFPCSRQESPTSPVGAVGMSLGFIGSDFFGSASVQVPDVDQIDFQVEAFIGYYLMDSESYILDSEGAPILDSEGVPIFGYALDSEGAPIFVGQSSGWCDIVMFNMIEQSTTVLPGTSAPSLTLSSSSSQNRPSSSDPSGAQFDAWFGFLIILLAIIVVVIVVVVVVTLLIFRKNRGYNKKDTDR
jgi:disulfide bond formation protein DsbB